jgi:hypothetical protein
MKILALSALLTTLSAAVSAQSQSNETYVYKARDPALYNTIAHLGN